MAKNAMAEDPARATAERTALIQRAQPLGIKEMNFPAADFGQGKGIQVDCRGL
jgi:hypothetical protein